jgi:RHS repeat-associated protein
MSGRTRQLIAIILIAALWMPAVMLPANAYASSPTDISGKPSAIASFLGLAWTKMAAIAGGATQNASQVSPPGMPQLEPAPTQPIEPSPPPSKADSEARVASLKMNPEGEVSLQPGQQMVMAATPLDDDGNAVHGLVSEWQSNNTEVVSITIDGLATANQPGKAQLTARAGQEQATLDVTVAIPTEAKLERRRENSTRPKSDQIIRSAQTAIAENSSERKMRSEVSLSHARTIRPVRAALSPQVIYEDNGYTNAVGSPPGRTEPGASTPPAAIAGTEKPGTANFSFQVPILSLPGRGLDVALSLAYNSHLWNKKLSSSGNASFSYDPDGGWPAPGFSLGYGKLLWDAVSENGFTLVDSDGTRHAMRPSNGSITDTSWETSDGTFIQFSGTKSGGGIASFPDGTRVRYGATSGSSAYPVNYPTTITDRNGNHILISYAGEGGVGPRISTIQDTLGRYVYFKYDTTNNALVAITAPGYAGGDDRQVIRFYYQNIEVNTNGSFAGGSASTIGPFTARVLSEVYFPGTQSGYHYDYSVPYGMIYRTTQLRGMTVSTTGLSTTGAITSAGQTAAWTEYNYPTTASTLSDVPAYTRRTDDWAGRTTGMNGNVAAAPFYTFEVVEGTDVSTSKVTAPDGTVTETQSYKTPEMYRGLVKEITIKQGTNVLAKTTMEWEPRDLISNDDGTVLTPIDLRIKKIRTRYEAEQTKTTIYSYTSYNNVSKIQEMDFEVSPGTPGPELRRTETSYEQGAAWIGRRLLHLVTSIKVFEGGSTVPLSWVKYDYDLVGGTSLTPRAGIEMHDPVYDPSSAMTYDSATDKRGNLSSVTAYADAATPSNPTVNTSSYDIAGNVVSQTVNCCRQKLFTYDAAYKFAYPTSQTRGDAGQLTSSASYDFNTGLARTSVDENNQVTTLYYFPDSLRLDYIRHPDTSFTQWHYGGDALVYAPDAAHLNSYVAVATSTGIDKVVWDYTFMDGRGAVARHFKGNPDPSQWESTDIEYDIMGRTTRQSNPYYSTGANSAINPAGLWTTVGQYDGLGRATRVTLPDGTAVQTAFWGTQTTVTDQAGRQRRQLTDALGRVRRVDEPDHTGSLGTSAAPTQPTSYDYDALDQLTRVTQAEAGGVTQQRTFKYDSLGHLTHERQVEATATLNSDGVRVGSGGQWTAVYQYDSHGLRTDAYDARGVHTLLEYDGLNRIHRVSYTGETAAVRTPAITYTYDEAHDGYFNQGRLTTLSTEAVSGTGIQAVPQTIQAYDYDLMGRVTAQRQTVGTDSYTLAYEYNQMGQLISEQYPSGRVVGYEYDDGARLSKVRNGSSGNYVSSLTYQAHGGVETMTLGNGAVESVSYNSRLQPAQLKLTVGGVEKQRFEYRYGVVDLTTGSVNVAQNTGQVARIEGFIDGVSQWQQRYSYDSLGRLDIASERRGDNLSVVDWQVNYDYDRWGNRKLRVAENQVSAPSYYPIEDSEIDTASNRLMASTGVVYDAAGNVIVDGKYRAGQQYGYDGNGRQRWTASGDGTQAAWAVYDGAGQRVQSSSGAQTGTFVYDIFGQMVAEYGGQGSSTSGTHYVMSDAQGSTRVIMNSNAAITARHDYLPFGEEIKVGTAGAGMRSSSQGYEQADSLRQKYAGMERDDSGVDHTLWRKYESRSGRWTTPDPYNGSMNVGDPQSFNRYSYVSNDPTNLVDPTGLKIGDLIGDGGKPETVHIYIWEPDFNWERTSGGRGGGIPHPMRWLRIPNPNIVKIRNDISTMLNDKCTKFLEALLKELGRQTGIEPFSNKVLDIFDEVASEGQLGFGLAKGGFVAFGQGTVGQANARVDFNYAPDPMSTVHELVHVAPNSGTRQYTHEQMALAAYDVAREQKYPGLGKRPESGLIGKEANAEYSRSFSRRLFAACRTN